MFTFCLVLNQSKQKCNAIKIKCRYRFSIMSIKRFRFHDQTFAFLRSNVSVSTIKRFHYIVTMETTVNRLPLFAKIKLLHSGYEYSN